MPSRVDPIRQRTPLLGERRREFLASYNETVDELRAIDEELTALAERRRQVYERLREQHHRLWLNLSGRGRRPMPDGSEALPAAAHDAKPLWGRRLRSVCLALLRAGGRPLSLVELHAALHLRGFVVDSRFPVKALADALGYEVLEGRVRRIARGVYELLPGARPALGRHGNPLELAT